MKKHESGDRNAFPPQAASAHSQTAPACYRRSCAEKLGVVVDAAAYFGALRASLLKARRCVYIVGWDIDTRTRLVDEAARDDGHPVHLLDLLVHLLDARPELEIHVVAWDYAMIYLFERQALPSVRFANAHPRLYFTLDGNHPVGASHHQKFVVIDDALAFVGGIDLTVRRWDRREHAPHDPGRVDPSGEPYAPMHDVMMCVSGPVARDLGQLARERLASAGAPYGLRRATDCASQESLAQHADALWPERVRIRMQKAPVRITRTSSARTAHERDIRESLEATLAAVRGARRYVFFENQYLTSAAVADAIRERLQEPDGPEFIVVLPREECGWLERRSMGALRAQVLSRLRDEDRYGRFHVYCPELDGLDSACLNVHSKVIVVDGELLKVGSSNLSNRSMGLDTECDLWTDAEGDAQRARAIEDVLCELLAEHCGATLDQMRLRVQHCASVARAIESFDEGPRRLAPLPLMPTEPLSALSVSVVDPEKPMAAETFARVFLPEYVRKPKHRALWSIAGIAVGFLTFVGAIALGRVYGPDYVDWLEHHARVLDSGFGPLVLVLGIALGSSVFVPITLLISLVAFAFQPLHAMFAALGGSLGGAALTYGVGRLAGRRVMVRWGGRRARAVEAALSNHALRSTLIARVLPVGSFTLINLVAGSMSVPFGRFMLGSLLGMLPGIVGMTYLVRRFTALFESPSAGGLIALFVVAAVFAGFMIAFSRLVARRGVARGTRPTSLSLRGTSP